jgi:hypothetical protein
VRNLIALVLATIGIDWSICLALSETPTPLLVRVLGSGPHMYGTLWLLTQGETRKAKRVWLFTESLSRRLSAYASLLAGLAVPGD